jgi:RNA polymerase sigma-70 factor, ECF subfamily
MSVPIISSNNPMTKTHRPIVISTRVRNERDDHQDVTSLKRLVQGDRDALADLYDAHAAGLYRHGLALTRSRSDAEDLVQGVFLKVAATGAPLLAVRHPANYLHRILRTAWIDGRRRAASRWEIQADPESVLPATDNGAATEDAIDAMRMIEQLPDVLREMVMLHLIEGFSFWEAGRITGASMFTAASRYRVALARLREMMGR